MARRGFWNGYLKLSLVTCPVSMTPATSDAESVRFHTLNRETGNRVEGVYVDEETGERVDDDDQARGYEREPGRYLVIEDEELDAVALESTRTIDIERFVPADSVGWLWYDKPHFLTPNDPVGEEAFAVIREAMKATRRVGLSRLVLYRRERPVMIEPRDKGIILWTLRYADELRAPDDYFGAIEAEAEDGAMDLVGKLIEARMTKWDRSLVRDPMQQRLKDLIAAKRKHAKPSRSHSAAEAGEEKPTNVVNIMDALRKSLAGSKGSAGSGSGEAPGKPRGRRKS